MNPSDSSQASDEELMLAYVAGHSGAFRLLFGRYAKLLVGLSTARGFPRAEAEDLAQQTFLQLHRARRDYDGSRRLRTWLLTIAYNLMRDRFRRAAVHQKALRQHQEDAQTSSIEATHDPLESAQKAELRRTEVHNALQQLAPDQREVIELHWFAELPFAEIASILGISQSNAKVKAHRGYERLKRMLSKTHPV